MGKLDTPLYKLSAEDQNRVYEPAEDSFLLLDALEDELNAIQRLRPLLTVEIGPGSGIVISALSKALGSACGFYLGVDINPHACRITGETARMNCPGCQVEVINMNLLAGFNSGLVDLLIFNPPYVPTSEVSTETELEEQIDQFAEKGHDLVKSWAGGLDGMAVTNKVLRDLDRLMSPNGVFYLLLLKENKPDEVKARLEANGFRMKIVKERKVRGEHLFVVRITRNPDGNS
ncbi:uncharacterized protein LOC129727886 [Wyeomyia smithii]|uniref:uncharacterized protein LOC129727886 n=1 Tax=Wyeomyia smithii TaxID=174621 RepID=UPI002467AE17|nr:uncharacterized protein LOC129727886 [Wyeomyia smithii]